MRVSGNDYVSFLSQTLQERIARNPKYSLRAFARDLGLPASNLSLLLREKRGLSPATAIRVAERLGLNEAESRTFCDLVALKRARTNAEKKQIEHRLALLAKSNAPYRLLADEEFKAIADWRYIALREMTELRDFQPEPRWIASRLGISALEAAHALAHLKRLGLLVERDGRLRNGEANVATMTDVPSPVLRTLTRRLLDQSSLALEEQAVEERDFGTVTMAIDPARIQAAKNMIRDFRRTLVEFLEQGERTEVYCFSTQLFRLTRGPAARAKRSSTS